MNVKRYPGIGPTTGRRGVYLGTRGSKLAMIQAESCREALLARHPALSVELRIVETSGDLHQDGPLHEVGGKGLFIKELDVALAQNQIQLAVHSMKDIPGEIAAGLDLVAITERVDPRDALISRDGKRFLDLPAGAKIGTSSLRRRAQALKLRPDLQIVTLRGNIETRLLKLDDGLFDAIILACAGLDRLKLGYRITERLDPEQFLPAAGQGALGVVVREKDFSSKSLAMGLTHVPTAMAVDAERALLRTLGGDCRVPIGAHGVVNNGSLRLEAEVLLPDGSRSLRLIKEGFGSVADSVGEELGMLMLEQGAHEILAQSHQLLK